MSPEWLLLAANNLLQLGNWYSSTTGRSIWSAASFLEMATILLSGGFQLLVLTPSPSLDLLPGQEEIFPCLRSDSSSITKT